MQSSTPIKQSFQTDYTSPQTCDTVSVHSESNNSDQQLTNSDSDCNVEVANLSLQVDQMQIGLHLLASSLGTRGTKWFDAQLLELLVAVFE
jgi:hypothetical protein